MVSLQGRSSYYTHLPHPTHPPSRGAFRRASPPHRAHQKLLWLLLALFAFRVVGQFAVSVSLAPFLPPMDQWQSGLMPYPALVASQVVILAGLGAVCLQFSRGDGYFVQPRRWLATPLWVAGWIYASATIVRYAVWMTIRPDQRWTGDLIPVVFHIILASSLLVVAHHQRTCRT